MSGAAKKALEAVDLATAETLTELATSSAYAAPTEAVAGATAGASGANPVHADRPSSDTPQGGIVPTSVSVLGNVARTLTVMGLAGFLGALSLAMIIGFAMRPRPDSSPPRRQTR